MDQPRNRHVPNTMCDMSLGVRELRWHATRPAPFPITRLGLGVGDSAGAADQLLFGANETSPGAVAGAIRLFSGR